jgi:chromosome segregation ATPase
MRRVVFLSLGVLEVLVALVLLLFAWQLPGSAEIQDGVGRLERVTTRTSAQVRQLRQQVHDLRERRPQMQELAKLLQKQMGTVTKTLRGQKVDFTTVQAVGDALGEVAQGLDGLSVTLDPKGVGQIGEGLRTAADFFEQQIAPTATNVARQLEQSTEDLRVDAARLSSLLREAPFDLRAARDVHDSLAKFAGGLERMNVTLRLERLGTMREGFKGLEDALSTGAGQVERLAGYTYPVVTFQGIRPVIDQKPFWPEGEAIADGMRKAAKGATAAGQEMAALADDLPRIQASLDESRKIVDRTREALATALKQQEKVEPLLRSAPEHAARLAEELPRLGAGLAKVLRDTAHLTEVAGVLRQAQKSVETAVKRWPELRKNLAHSAVLLRETQRQLNQALEHRHEYEASLEQSLAIANTFSSALPLVTVQLEDHLLEQEESLDGLGASIDEVGAALQPAARTASHILQTSRLLMGLVAAIFALHGGYLVLGTRLGRRYSL